MVFTLQYSLSKCTPMSVLCFFNDISTGWSEEASCCRLYQHRLFGSVKANIQIYEISGLLTF